MELDIEKRGERHKALNQKARDIHSIAKNINEKIYEQDIGLDSLVKKNVEARDNTLKAQGELWIAKVDRTDQNRILGKKRKMYCLICIAVTSLCLMSYMLLA